MQERVSQVVGMTVGKGWEVVLGVEREVEGRARGRVSQREVVSGSGVVERGKESAQGNETRVQGILTGRASEGLCVLGNGLGKGSQAGKG